MIRTGIGGWVYPDWRGGTFYPPGLPQKRELEYASRAVGVIEINSTFHSLQKPDSFRRWRAEVPDNFVFALKGSRFITNRKDLATAKDAFGRFWDQGMVELGESLGPVLWQLAATKRFVAHEIAAFFELLPRSLGPLQLRHAIEARHESFACAEFVELARKANVAVAYVEDGVCAPLSVQTADFTYARFKQMSARYKAGYAPVELERIAGLCRTWEKSGGVFALMINGCKAKAPAAAQALARLVAQNK